MTTEVKTICDCCGTKQVDRSFERWHAFGGALDGTPTRRDFCPNCWRLVVSVVEDFVNNAKKETKK
jgi:hypothetical protein